MASSLDFVCAEDGVGVDGQRVSAVGFIVGHAESWDALERDNCR